MIDAGSRSGSDDARARILTAGLRCLVRDGVAAASMAVIAAEASVSKALLHYHFDDRTQLLTELVNALGRRLITRERRAQPGNEPAASVDHVWQWIKAELDRGELRALLELGTVRASAVRHAVEDVSNARRSSTAITVRLVFTRLGLTPRVPAELIADAFVAFVDGLALDGESDRDARVSFDVFWLSMLSLGD